MVQGYYISEYVLEIPPKPPPKLDSINKCVSTPLFHIESLLTDPIFNDITFVIEIVWASLKYLNMRGGGGV